MCEQTRRGDWVDGILIDTFGGGSCPAAVRAAVEGRQAGHRGVGGGAVSFSLSSDWRQQAGREKKMLKGRR